MTVKVHTQPRPATETALCRAPEGSPEDVAEAVGVARLRFDDCCWSEASPAHRVEVLNRLADLFVEHASELAPRSASPSSRSRLGFRKVVHFK